MKFKAAFLLLFSLAAFAGFAQGPIDPLSDIRIRKRVDSLLTRMTLEEKIGQMAQISNPNKPTGPTYAAVESESIKKRIREGKLGSLLNLFGADITRKMQEIAVKESRLGIPLLFGLDVIHGFKTIFPIPLASSCSWDLKWIEESERVAAREAAASGIHWTFAPMVDIARDARWGRMAEGAGEDPFLGSRIAEARVRGFQGADLQEEGRILACVKHFAAYGNAEAGRDYNTTDMSERLLREIYLPPYKAAIDAGVGTVMSSFNEFNGTPSTINSFLQKDILRKEFGFKGFVVSDWGSIVESIVHGAAKNKAEATVFAMNSMIDMDMENRCYPDTLKQLVESGVVPVGQVDEAVRRILAIKFRMGLFENPYRNITSEKEQSTLMSKEHQQAAIEMSRRSIVLLKNNGILPLAPRKRVAVIGPLASSGKEMNGCWAWLGDPNPVGYLAGIRKKLGQENVLYARGCNLNDDSTQWIPEAVETAQKADVVVLCVGESFMMSGESNNRTHLDLPGVQKELVAAVLKTGKPVVLLLTNGRPLSLGDLNEKSAAIVDAWFLGTRAGDAVADVLVGDYNPSGKLTVSFPVTVGQVPIYYNHKNTGRPNPGEKRTGYISRYNDCPNAPQYPFGFGLSYTRFSFSNLKMDQNSIRPDGVARVEVTVENAGSRDGEEVVQLYIHDRFAHGVARPVKELKGFKKVFLKKGESQKILFELGPEQLSSLDLQLKRRVEPGEFEVFVGNSSRNEDLLKTVLTVTP